ANVLLHNRRWNLDAAHHVLSYEVGQRSAEMLPAALVLCADEFQQLRIGHQLRAQPHCERLFEHARVGHSLDDFQEAKACPADALGDAELLRMRSPCEIEPRAVFE